MEPPENANEGCPGPASSSAGKQASCQGCPNKAACSTGTLLEDPGLKAIRAKMSMVKHKVLVLSGKGGVGKSTVSSQLAFRLAYMGFNIGLCDIDLCGPSIPRMMGLEGHQVHTSSQGWQPVYVQQNLAVMSIGFLLSSKNDAVIWRGPKKTGLIKQFLSDVNWGELDILLIDTPPGTSDEHLSLVQLLQPGERDGAVVISTPQQVSVNDVRKEVSFCNKTKVRVLGVVENMAGFVCPNCKCQSAIFPEEGGIKRLCQQFGLQLIARVPIEPKVGVSCERGEWQGQREDSPAGRELSGLAKKLCAKLGLEMRPS